MPPSNTEKAKTTKKTPGGQNLATNQQQTNKEETENFSNLHKLEIR